MHGGDIYSSSVQYDFSVNLNPLGLSERVKEAYFSGINTVGAYPDRECRTLRLQLAQKLCACGNANVGSDSILFGNGASELIPAVLRARKVKKALLVAPCFTGYKRAIDSVGGKADYFYLQPEQDFEFGFSNLEEFLAKLKDSSADAVILTNPNNPNGRLIERSVVEKVAEVCAQRKVLLLLDECFIELTGKSSSHSFLPLIKNYKNVVVLRAFTKTFALPGLRLGYVVCADHDFLTFLQLQLPEWNISTVSQICGRACLEDTDYLKRARVVISEEKKSIQRKLKALGFYVFGSDSNFILFKSQIRDLKERLLNEGVLIRDCRDFEGLEEGFYRVCIKAPKENPMLWEKIQKIINECEKD